MLNLSSFAMFQARDAENVAAGLLGLGCFAILALAIFGLAILAFVIYCWWRIFTKAGFSGALSLLILVPGIGALILLLLLAFGDWPALKNRQ